MQPRVMVIGMLCVLLLMPAVSEAQRFRSRYSSETQTAINNLGSSAVQAVPIPIVLGVEVGDLTKNFGDPRSGGRTHEGLDIMAPEWTPVASPTDAVVTSIGNGTNSGLYVRTANPGSETFVYMHLVQIASGVERGTVLKKGDVLGFVGNTGNASGGQPHLHFEIRRGGATDPFPRLTTVFTLDEKMAAAEQALTQASNSSIAQILASNFLYEFRAAQNADVTVPSNIAPLLADATASNTSSNGSRILGVGDSGSEVVHLQEFLIERDAGSAAQHLAGATATGYFGLITEAALKEYQAATAIAATGYVDKVTYQLVFTLAAEGSGGDEVIAEVGFLRDLEPGMNGEDVRLLQMFLNEAGFTVAPTGAGSPGHETDYFGPATQQALSAFQKAHTIAPSVGYFGPITRAVVASL